MRTIESAKCLVAGLFQQKQIGRVIHVSMLLVVLFWISSNLFLLFSLLLEEIVPILTTEAESEILYPNYHGCKLLKILGRYVEATQNWKLE